MPIRLGALAAGNSMSLADRRRTFVAGAPVDADLTTFFEEWFDRAGSLDRPPVASRWHGTRPDRGRHDHAAR